MRFPIHLTSLLIAGWITAGSSQAASYTWSGGNATSGNFTSGDNWVGGSAPAYNVANTFTFSGTPTQTAPQLDGNATTSLYSTTALSFDASLTTALTLGPTSATGAANRFSFSTGGTLTQNSNNAVTINAGAFIGASQVLTLSGTGSGALTLNTVRGGGSSSIIAGRSVTFNTLTTSTGSLTIRAYSASANTSQTITFAGTDTGALTNLVLNSSSNSNGGSPSGAGSVSYVQASNASGLVSDASVSGNDMTFAGSNAMTFNGGLTLYGGANKTVTFSNTGGTTIQGTAQLGAASGNATRTVTFTVNSAATATLSANLTGSTSTGTTSIAKNGVGTLILSGTSNINGTTTVTNGTLLINGDQSAAAGNVSVSGSGVTLGGNGTVGGATTIADTSILSPGSDTGVAGTLTFNTKNLTLSGTDTKITMEITGTGSGSYDKIVGIDALSLNGDLTISLSGSYTNASWDLFDFASKSGNFDTIVLAGSYAGSLNRSGDLWTGTIGGQNWTFSQVTGGLSVVPEPATWALVAGGLTVTMVLRRRSKIS